MPRSSKRLTRLPGSYDERKGRPMYGGSKKLLKLPMYGGGISHSESGYKSSKPLLSMPGQRKLISNR